MTRQPSGSGRSSEGATRRTKTSEVLEHLRKGTGISSMEAFSMFGATRLSAIIFQLRRKGYVISGREQTTVDRYGRKVRYYRYFLESEPSA